MKIFDLMKKFTKRNQIKQTKKSIDKGNWKEPLHYETSKTDIEENLEEITPMEEKIRNEQIAYVCSIVLNKEDLKKEDMAKYIKKKYKKVLLNDVDMQSLISIYHAIEHEDMYGNYNIREFIDEDENNIVKLVNELVLNAKVEARKQKSKDISKFVITDFKLIGEVKNQLEINDYEVEFDR